MIRKAQSFSVPIHLVHRTLYICDKGYIDPRFINAWKNVCDQKTHTSYTWQPNRHSIKVVTQVCDKRSPPNVSPNKSRSTDVTKTADRQKWVWKFILRTTQSKLWPKLVLCDPCDKGYQLFNQISTLCFFSDTCNDTEFTVVCGRYFTRISSEQFRIHCRNRLGQGLSDDVHIQARA